MSKVEAYLIPDFCKTHGVSRAYVYNEIKAGRLKARKRGRRTVILADAAKEWRENLPELTLGNAA